MFTITNKRTNDTVDLGRDATAGLPAWVYDQMGADGMEQVQAYLDECVVADYIRNGEDDIGIDYKLTDKAQEIAEEKELAGGDAWLYLHESGDCILWASEEDSEDESLAVARWNVDINTYIDISCSGLVDERG